MTADGIRVSCRFHQAWVCQRDHRVNKAAENNGRLTQSCNPDPVATTAALQVHAGTILSQPFFAFTVVRQHLIDKVPEGSGVVEIPQVSQLFEQIELSRRISPIAS
jgi:hypothetical protein